MSIRSIHVMARISERLSHENYYLPETVTSQHTAECLRGNDYLNKMTQTSAGLSAWGIITWDNVLNKINDYHNTCNVRSSWLTSSMMVTIFCSVARYISSERNCDSSISQLMAPLITPYQITVLSLTKHYSPVHTTVIFKSVTKI